MAFFWPFFSVILAILLAYFPHFFRVALVMLSGQYDNAKPRAYSDQHDTFSDEKRALLTRLASAHNNQLETLGVYAAGVTAAFFSGSSRTLLNVMSAVYIGARVVYIAVYAMPQVASGYIRSLTFVVCLSSVFVIWGIAAF